MFEIRIHGRGGQGAVTAAELLATAAFYDGKSAQAFPSFGVERRGAPVEAFCKINDKFIRSRKQIYEPDCLIIQDMTLIGSVDVFRGIKDKCLIILNTEKELSDISGLPQKKGYEYITVPATQIAINTLGKPIINTALIGSFAGATRMLKASSLARAIKERFPRKLAAINVKAMNTAYCHANPNDEYCFCSEKCSVKIDDSRRFAISC